MPGRVAGPQRSRLGDEILASESYSQIGTRSSSKSSSGSSVHATMHMAAATRSDLSVSNLKFKCCRRLGHYRDHSPDPSHRGEGLAAFMLSIFELQLEAALIFSLSESAAGFGR